MTGPRGRNVTDFAGIGTPMIPLAELRVVTDEDAADIVSLVGNHGLEFSALSASQVIDIRALFNTSFAALVLAFYASDNGTGEGLVVENDHCGLDLFGYREGGGPPMHICGTALTTGLLAGTMETATEVDGTAITSGTAYWIDTIVLSHDDSIFNPIVFDSANNKIAMIHMDLCGCRYIYPRLAGMSKAVSSEIPAITLVGSVY